VIDKPPGLVVHPAPGHPSGTLVNGLLHHCPDLAAFGGEIRPGIVHRLDKDTSGVMVVAKQPAVHEHLAAQFQQRAVRKTYLAIVRGNLSSLPGGNTVADWASSNSPEADVNCFRQATFGRDALPREGKI
jgi:23S rRNA pseudouridine1911/1915/1917 synthase